MNFDDNEEEHPNEDEGGGFLWRNFELRFEDFLLNMVFLSSCERYMCFLSVFSQMLAKCAVLQKFNKLRGQVAKIKSLGGNLLKHIKFRRYLC